MSMLLCCEVISLIGSRIGEETHWIVNWDPNSSRLDHFTLSGNERSLW